jgi:hypothetical protein
MAGEPKENQVVRTYSLKPVNITFLARRAAEETIAGGTYVSASAWLDRLIDAAREAEERVGETRRVKKGKWN